jgi:hypothetical protein
VEGERAAYLVPDPRRAAHEREQDHQRDEVPNRTHTGGSSSFGCEVVEKSGWYYMSAVGGVSWRTTRLDVSEAGEVELFKL